MSEKTGISWTDSTFGNYIFNSLDKRAVIRQTPHLTWQLLTKRAEGYKELLPNDLERDPRVWKGITAENQEWYDKRWPEIAFLHGVRWVSYEPALGRIWNLSTVGPLPDWIVFGGESGDRFRPVGTDMNGRSWAEETKQMCDPAFGQLHHTRGRGMGGGKRDDRETELLCNGCHAKEHQTTLRRNQ